MLDHAMIPAHPMRDALLGVVIDNRVSDFYYTVGTHPGAKISGEIAHIDEGIDKITPEEAKSFAQSLITFEQHEQLLRTKNLDFSFEFNGARFRGNVSFQM